MLSSREIAIRCVELLRQRVRGIQAIFHDEQLHGDRIVIDQLDAQALAAIECIVEFARHPIGI